MGSPPVSPTPPWWCLTHFTRVKCVHLPPPDVDKLLLHQAGFRAQKRRARGLRRNSLEAVALIATQILEFIRDGRSVAERMDLGGGSWWERVGPGARQAVRAG